MSIRFITNCRKSYLELPQLTYYKLQQVYYKLRQVLQIAANLLQIAIAVTNCDRTPVTARMILFLIISSNSENG